MLSIQNTSQSNPFKLTSVVAKNWSSHLQMVVDPLDANSCENLNSTNGTWTGDITIPASSTCNIHYTYGPTTDIEAGLAQQEFVGSFSTQSFRLPLNTKYQADKTNIITVESGAVTTPTDPISFDPATNTTEFELVYSNVAQVKFTYKGNISAGFLVKDSDIPYGFIPNNTKTTCPTTSKGNAAGTLTGSCDVVYDYMHQELSDSLFYSEVAKNQMIEVYPPSYQVIDAGKSIHVVIPDHNTTATHIKADSFANVTSVDDPITTSSTTQVYHTVHFNLGADYDKQNLLNGGSVTIQPDWEQSPLVSASSAGSCVIASGATSCDIELAVAKTLTGTSFPLKFVAYSSKDSEYNAIRGVASIKLR